MSKDIREEHTSGSPLGTFSNPADGDVNEEQRLEKTYRGPIAWMTRNSVAANLLMLFILAIGLKSVLSLKQEVFPDFDLDLISVTIPYPGASPLDVEQGIVLAVEEQIRNVDGIKNVYATAAEGIAAIQVELLLGVNSERALADIKNNIDRITTFPDNVEEAQVSLIKPKSRVISLVIYGDRSRKELHAIGEDLRLRLLDHRDITQVELTGVSPQEISIDVDQAKLQDLNLSLNDIAQRIRGNSIEIPSGNIETKQGDLLLRVSDRRRSGDRLAQMPILGSPNGVFIRLDDLGEIKDGYEDDLIGNFYQGSPAIVLDIYRIGDETPLEIAPAVKSFVENNRKNLPMGVEMRAWSDRSELLEGRIDLLVRNAKTGLILVLIILALFLDASLAFWVAMGIPISFMGSFFFMDAMGASINMISLFGLIVTLGMVVDDALIVGENIYLRRQEGYSFAEAALKGSSEMATPVTFAILTTIASFSPLLLVPGVSGKFFRILPIVVISVLFCSLVESFFVLPAHLAHENGLHRFITWLLAPIDFIREGVARGLEFFTHRIFKPLLIVILNQRYISVAFALSLFFISQGIASGKLPFNFLPKLESNSVSVSVRLPFGSPEKNIQAVHQAYEKAAEQTKNDFGPERVLGMLTEMGQGGLAEGPGSVTNGAGARNVFRIRIELVGSEERDFSAKDFVDHWAENVPPQPNVEAVTFKSATGPSGDKDIEVQVRHPDSEVVGQVAKDFESALKDYNELRNVSSTFTAGKRQISVHLKPEGVSEGLSASMIGQTLRNAYFGAEAIREQRGRNQIKVMVRLLEEQREDLALLGGLQIKTPLGKRLRLDQVAEFESSFSPTSIARQNGIRKVDLSANLAVDVKEPGPVIQSIKEVVIPKIVERYPGASVEFVGQQERRRETLGSLFSNGLLALLMIYALLAIPFKSYSQPLIILAAIPFGMIGAIWGHVLMGYGLSIISYFGMVALMGVVINDSLVLIECTNQARKEGQSAFDAIIYGATRRLRPILLTSLTTFFGLAPMIFETSLQARFLIPMAISLGFGILVATGMILTIVPAFYMIVEDIKNLPKVLGHFMDTRFGPSNG